ncbi:hypothetical protein [Halostagnicola bangensis]
MGNESKDAVQYGIGGVYGWPVGGVLGGVIGTGVFGLLVWFVNPEIIQATIPGLYGFEPGSETGWVIHLVHGAILGLVFAFIVTRDLVLGTLLASVETEALSELSDTIRFVGAGFAYGILVWTILPVFAAPAQIGLISQSAIEEFPALAAEAMIGHVLFGMVLGAVFAVSVDVSARSVDDTLEN